MPGAGDASPAPGFGDRLAQAVERPRVADRPRDRPRSRAPVAGHPRGQRRAARARRRRARRHGRRRRRARARPRRRGGRRRRARPLPRADRRRRPRLRRGQAAARLLRASRLRGLARARGHLRARARRRAARARRRQARRRAGDRHRLRAGARRQHAVAVRRRARPRRSTPSPPTRCSGATRSSRSLEVARAAGAGVFLLVRTSNPGAADVLDLPLATGEPLWERLAALAAELGEGSPLADVGAVTGATVPEHLARMRELMPRTPFLLPGVGAQGGDVRDLAPAFAAGRAGGLVTASRSIANAHEQARRNARRGRARARPSACASSHGASPDARYHRPDGPSQPRALSGAARAGGLRRRALRRREQHPGTAAARARAAHSPPRAPPRRPRSRRRPRKLRRTYRVKPGDTPSSIAEKTNVPLSQIQELNPNLDDQTLSVGQKIKLRP